MNLGELIILLGAVTSALIASAILLDYLVSKSEEKRLRSYLFNWWFYLEQFNYRRAIKKANVRCNRLLNSIFGKKHFTLRCFAISSLISLLSMLVIGCIYYTYYFADNNFIIRYKSDNENQFVYHLVSLIVVGLLLNVTSDYFSLIETRCILRISLKKPLSILMLLLFFDFLFSIVIFVVFSFLFLFPMKLWLLGIYKIFDTRWGIIFYFGQSFLTRFKSLYADRFILLTYTIVFLLTSLTTSILFYLYCLFTVLVKVFHLSKSRLQNILVKLEESNHLFKAIGVFLSGVVGFCLAVYKVIECLM